ncbi:MAG: mandelate racemase/muconate lactonizing enzyme family protein [Chloroflexi bacterium]|nr:mandelate racemase/muconate lactonizing enzyme family protein [Chloroflexota bacterium]
MKITDIRTMLLRGPRLHNVGGGQGTATKLIVQVDTDAGLYGLGEADNFMGVREAIGYIRESVIGRDPLEIGPIVSEMLYGTLPPHPSASRRDVNRHSSTFRPVLMCSPTATPTGPIAWGMSGVEIALCDLAGKICRTPVYNLLGGKFRDRVRVYLDRSSPDDVANLDAWKQMGLQVVEEGFTHMKFDIDFTAPDYTEDVWNRSIPLPHMNQIVERISAVRQAVGWNTEICVDGHMHFNTTTAIQLAHELAPLKLTWFEDPTPITNPDSCAEVRAKSQIPICVGEMFIAEHFRLFIDSHACDIIHPDIMFCGGLHEARKIADYAELNHIPMAMHGNGGSLATIAAAHVAAASRNFMGLEYHWIESTWIGEYVYREGVPLFADGYIPLPDIPGLGVELNREVCEKYLAPSEKML